MVVFLDGEPAKGEYRTFKVKSATNDDFASMYEVLSRRFRRSKSARRADGRSEQPKGWVVPDLLVIDGGKGQLVDGGGGAARRADRHRHERHRRGRRWPRSARTRAARSSPIASSA